MGKTETELVLRPSKSALDSGACTRVPLRFTASGQGLLPLLPARTAPPPLRSTFPKLSLYTQGLQFVSQINAGLKHFQIPKIDVRS
jgi:hypothetical protein